MPKRRVSILKKVKVKLLVKNKRTCCICRDFSAGRDINIHHIDGNPSNNNPQNLAVLCLTHASQADAGLKKGQVGSGKKLSPEEVTLFKQKWESKVQAEVQIEKHPIVKHKKEQMEILYKFEINKIKNEILSLPKNQKEQRTIKFEFLQQLVLEEFTSGLNLRKMIMDALGDMSARSVGDSYIAVPIIRTIQGLFLHLIGPEEVKIDKADRNLLIKALDNLEILGDFGAWLAHDRKTLRETCQTIFELSEIAYLYDFELFIKSARKVLKEIMESCSKYGEHYDIDKKQIYEERKKREKIVDRILKKINSITE